MGPGGTIEEVEEGGTAPATATQALPAAAVVPVPVANAAAVDATGLLYDAAGLYDQQQPRHSTTHYHLNDDHGGRGSGRRRRRAHSRGAGGDGVLRLVDRERRRDSDRHMADADASHRREAMMMGLVDRERDRDRDRDRGGGAGLDARDVLGMLLDGEAERRRRERSRDGVTAAGERSDGGGGYEWKGALDALSRRVDEMALLGRDERETGSAAAGTKEKNGRAQRVKFTRDRVGSDSAGNANGSGSGAGIGSRPSKGKKNGAAPGGRVVFSRGVEGKQEGDGGTDTDSDETSGSSSAGGGTRLGGRGRTLRRAGSPSTSVD